MNSKSLILAAISMVVAACSSDDVMLESGMTHYPDGVIGIMPTYEYGDHSDGDATRVNLEVTETGISFQWSAGDQIGGIGFTKNPYDEKIFQMTNFSVTSLPSNRMWANFNGGAFRLSSGAKYFAFYPYTASTIFSPNQCERTLSFKLQKQTGNSSTSHLSPYNYMVAPMVTTDTVGNCQFFFVNNCCPCRFTLTLPASAQGKSIDELTITRYGNADLRFVQTTQQVLTDINEMQGVETVVSGLVYNPSEQSIKQTLSFQNCTIDNSLQLVAWEMLFPADHSSGRYYVTLKCSDGTLYAGNVAGKKLLAGKAYRFTASLSDCVEMTSGVNYALVNNGCTLPADLGTGYTHYADVPDEVKSQLPTVAQAQAFIENIDYLLGSGYSSEGALNLGLYLRKNSSDDVVFFPVYTSGTSVHTADYWLKDGSLLRLITGDTSSSTEHNATILSPEQGHALTAVGGYVRLVK